MALKQEHYVRDLEWLQCVSEHDLTRLDAPVTILGNDNKPLGVVLTYRDFVALKTLLKTAVNVANELGAAFRAKLVEVKKKKEEER